MTDVVVRPIHVDDLDAVVAVHVAAFADSALTRLGPGLVARYYTWLLTGPHDVAAFGAFDARGELTGFVVAGRFHRALSGFVHANRRRIAIRILSRPWLVVNPVLRARIQSAWRWIWQRNLPVSSEAERRTGIGVLAIAVDPRRQRTGVGASLLEAVESAARLRSCHRLHLTVDPANDGAVAFYLRLGWHKLPAESPWKGAMGKDLARHLDRADSTD